MALRFRHYALAAMLAAGAVSGTSSAHAQAMESAQEFWRNQARQQEQSATADAYANYGNYSRNALGYAEWTPEFGQSGGYGAAPVPVGNSNSAISVM
jgi:hypothetical protein